MTCLTAHQRSKRSFSFSFLFSMMSGWSYRLQTISFFGTILYIIKVCVHYYMREDIWLCHSYLRFNIDHIARLSFYDYNLLFIVGYISYFFYLWNFDFYKYLWAEFSIFFVYWIDHIDYLNESLNYGSSFWFLFYRFWHKIFERRTITFVSNGLIFQSFHSIY